MTAQYKERGGEMEKDVMKRALEAHAKMQKSMFERDRKLLSMPGLPIEQKPGIQEKGDIACKK